MKQKSSLGLNLTIGIVFLGIVVGVFFLVYKKSSPDTPTIGIGDNPTIPLGNPATSSDAYVGDITTDATGKSTYTNNMYGIQFTYPSVWRVGDNHLGRGTLQLFNYPETIGGKGGFSSGMNKIEAGISDESDYGVSSDYPEKTRASTEVIIATKTARRTQIELAAGEKILSYSIPFDRPTGKYLNINIYGDATNFSALDNLVKSIVFLK